MQRFQWRRGRAAPAGAPSGGAGARAAGRPPRRWPQTPAHHSPAVVLRGAARGRWQSSQSSTTRREGIACSGQAAYAHCPLPSQRSTRPDLSGLHCLPGVLSNAIDPSELSDRGGTERMHILACIAPLPPMSHDHDVDDRAALILLRYYSKSRPRHRAPTPGSGRRSGDRIGPRSPLRQISRMNRSPGGPRLPA